MGHTGQAPGKIATLAGPGKAQQQGQRENTVNPIQRIEWVALVGAALGTHAGWALAAVYAQHANSTTGQARPSLTRLAEKTGLSPRALRYARSKMIRLGWLKRIGGGHRGAATEIRLTTPRGVELPTLTAVEAQGAGKPPRKGATPCPLSTEKGGKSAQERGQPVAPQPGLEPERRASARESAEQTGNRRACNAQGTALVVEAVTAGIPFRDARGMTDGALRAAIREATAPVAPEDKATASGNRGRRL